MQFFVEKSPKGNEWLQGWVINDETLERYRFDARLDLAKRASENGIKTWRYPDGDYILELNLQDEFGTKTIMSYNAGHQYWYDFKDEEHKSSIDSTVIALALELEEQ